MIYNSADEVPPEMGCDLIDGLILVGEKLREWREYGGFHTLTAELLNADGTVTIRCHPDDRVTLTDGDQSFDFMDAPAPHD